MGEKYQDLLYVRRKFIHQSQLRNAIAEIINATFNIRLPQIWGEGTTTCASDSKKFGAWDQNLMTEWHIRYVTAHRNKQVLLKTIEANVLSI